MLRKLMKYELRATGRVMLPLFLVLIAATTALALHFHFAMDADSYNPTILSVVLVGIFIAAIIVAIFVSILLVLQRFYRNLLGNEGYLMFSLPVSTADNILSKGLTALVWLVVGAVTGGICGLIMMAVVGDFSVISDQLQNFWTLLTTSYGQAKAVRFLILMALTIILSALDAIFKVYAAISVGHQWGEHRILGSILAYLGFSIIEGILSVAIGLRGNYEVVPQGSGLTLDYPFVQVTITAVAGILIYGFLTWILLDRRLNLE